MIERYTMTETSCQQSNSSICEDESVPGNSTKKLIVFDCDFTVADGILEQMLFNVAPVHGELPPEIKVQKNGDWVTYMNCALDYLGSKG